MLLCLVDPGFISADKAAARRLPQFHSFFISCCGLDCLAASRSRAGDSAAAPGGGSAAVVPTAPGSGRVSAGRLLLRALALLPLHLLPAALDLREVALDVVVALLERLDALLDLGDALVRRCRIGCKEEK